jgi:dimethylhistidine N-methyltransferase
MLDSVNNELLADALDGLTAERKSLPPKWFYDHKGSELFEQITTLPEYYPTRTEAAILREHGDLLAGLVPDGGSLIELGSGASVKTRTLLSAGSHFGAYVPVDISESFLLATAEDLRTRYPGLAISPVVADFTGPFQLPLRTQGSKVGFFPGSTIGNLDPEQAVRLLRRARAWDDVEAFILGADLIKDTGELIAAYDDAQGVTAAFNMNLLSRLNHEIGANFDLSTFRHEAWWVGDRIEMHLVSTKAQIVRLPGLDIPFGEGESIHTESCRKYTVESLAALAEEAGWRLDQCLTDDKQRFAVTVLRPD